MFRKMITGIKLILSMSILLIIAAGSLQFKIKSLVEVEEKKFNDDAGMSSEYWDMIEETVKSPDKVPVQVKHVANWFANEVPSPGFPYVYGGKTAQKIQKGTTKTYSGVLACYLDNKEYSGVSLSLGVNKSVDCESLRKDKTGGVAFWAKGVTGNEIIYIGLLDDESDGSKTQTKVALRDFGKLDTTWNYFMIPLKKFSSNGKYWDELKKSEVLKAVDWKRIGEVRFSINSRENGSNVKDPVKVYVEQVSIIDNIPGYFDSDRYWETFTSNKPDRLLHDFEKVTDQKWGTGKGPASKVSYEFVTASENGYGNRSLSISYHLNDWCDVMYDYPGNSIPIAMSNWTDYWGLKLSLYSSRPYQAINIQITDAGNELYIASCGGAEGWNEILIPFRDFEKFPYYQPPNARHDGKFNLDTILMLDIKPAGEGTAGTFYVDNIALTNSRTAKAEAVATEKSVNIKGSFSQVITKNINDGIFGINSAHWDSDLLVPSTVAPVKAVRHKVLRIPGGLSSDEYHWKEMLAKKDVNIDIDEFLGFADKTGCETMITVNFGSGTPKEAADWVEYVNVKNKKNVKLWEIGNELYGDWHKFHCTADQYGKRAVEFINAMKKADPSILITVVWELDGEWNKTVFNYVKDIADGVNVHNYPQESGEENDIALLASPQTLDNIIPNVRKQLAENGQSGKKYQIWLTEWNSVDFNPGPQSLSIVNGVFVADYLGMLAKHNIEQASYWNIHNSLFEQGGDYGYLSRSDAPEGVNVTRPSYWAFKLASESLRGSLVQCETNDKKVTAYASLQKDGTKTLLVINKNPRTSAVLSFSIPEFKGTGIIGQLTSTSTSAGYVDKVIDFRSSSIITVPPYSITKIQLK